MDTRPAKEPKDLSRFFVERANDGDLEGLMALYEPRALLAGPKGRVFLGADAIRGFYDQFLATRRNWNRASSASRWSRASWL